MNSNPNERPVESNQNTSYKPDPNWYNPYESNFPAPSPDPSRYPPYQAFPTPQLLQSSYAPYRAGASIPASQPTPPSSPGMLPTVALPGTYGYGGPTPPSTPPPSSSRRTLLVALAAIVILAGIGFAIFIPYQNAQTEKANATATADTHATTIAKSATGTVVANNATATAQAGATATVVAANPNPYPPNKGNLVVIDSLSAPNNNLSNQGNCTFTNGAYHIKADKGYTQSCAGGSSFSNFAFEADMTIIQGDCGGLVFRDDTTNNEMYQFEICQNGNYGLFVQGQNGNYTTIQNNSTTSAFRIGLNQLNTLAVVADGQKIDLYVNKQLVSSLNDNSSSRGIVGFLADGVNDPTEVAFANEKVWNF